jgi:transposase
MYKWHQVKMLRSKGLSIKKISKKMRLSKNTVRKYVRSSEPPKFKPRQYNKILNEYEDTTKEMLRKGYIGTRIYNELVAMGYKGSLPTVYRYLAGIREKETIKEKVTTRVETPPGKQMQYDWKEWNLPVDGKGVKIYIHEIVLSYSRKKYYTYSLTIITQDIIRAIATAISYFGGVPEELVIDNPKQMVITHKRNATVRYNDEFLRFCGLYGIEPNACQTYRARTKGKAERPFYYIQEHLLRGLEVKHLSDFDPKLKYFMDSYNAREHSTLKESPDGRFLTERDFLHDIPCIEPAVLYERQIKKVSNEGYISWAGRLYPVPMCLCLRNVMVEKIFGRHLTIYAPTGEMVAEHPIRLFDNGIRPPHPEHEQINRGYRERKEARRSFLIKRFIETFHENGEIYIEGLKQTVGANLYWHLEEIARYTELYSVGEIGEAITECTKMGAYHKNSVKRLLGQREMKSPCMETTCMPPFSVSVTIERPLSAYKVEVDHA